MMFAQRQISWQRPIRRIQHMLPMLVLLLMVSALTGCMGTGNSATDEPVAEETIVPTDTPTPPLPTDTPTPSPTPEPETVAIIGDGFVQQETTLLVAFVSQNLLPDTMLFDTHYDVEIYDAADTLLNTTSVSIALHLPGQFIGVSRDVPLPSGVEVARIAIEPIVNKQHTVDTANSLPLFVADRVGFLDRTLSTAIGIVTSSYPEDVTDVLVYAIAYNEDNEIIGAGMMQLDVLEAQSDASVQVPLTLAEPPTGGVTLYPIVSYNSPLYQQFVSDYEAPPSQPVAVADSDSDGTHAITDTIVPSPSVAAFPHTQTGATKTSETAAITMTTTVVPASPTSATATTTATTTPLKTPTTATPLKITTTTTATNNATATTDANTDDANSDTDSTATAEAATTTATATTDAETPTDAVVKVPTGVCEQNAPEKPNEGPNIWLPEQQNLKKDKKTVLCVWLIGDDGQPIHDANVAATLFYVNDTNEPHELSLSPATTDDDGIATVSFQVPNTTQGEIEVSSTTYDWTQYPSGVAVVFAVYP